MTRKPSRQLLERSCAWLREHWNANNLDVPDDLLRQWIYQTGEDEEEPSGFHLAVFTFGYLQYDFIASNVPYGMERTVGLNELLERFGMWQMKLALAEIHRRTQLKTKPLPLFAFSADQQVQVWDERSKPA